jgi:hypothetical protein
MKSIIDLSCGEVVTQRIEHIFQKSELASVVKSKKGIYKNSKFWAFCGLLAI